MTYRLLITLNCPLDRVVPFCTWLHIVIEWFTCVPGLGLVWTQVELSLFWGGPGWGGQLGDQVLALGKGHSWGPRLDGTVRGA